MRSEIPLKIISWLEQILSKQALIFALRKGFAERKWNFSCGFRVWRAMTKAIDKIWVDGRLKLYDKTDYCLNYTLYQCEPLNFAIKYYKQQPAP